MLRPDQARYQPNSYACGPAALRHAMLCYGSASDVRELLRLGGPACCNEGVDGGECEHQLQRAAAELEFKLDHVCSHTTADAWQTLRGLLAEHVPVLLCVEHYAHWVVAVRATARHVWIADSSRDQEEILQRWTWRGLLRRVAYGLPDEVRFDLYPLRLRS